MLKRTLFMALASLTTLIPLVGCSNSDMGNVAGKVTFAGNPAPEGIRVEFQPNVPNGSSSVGYTNENGEYQMSFTASKPGVMVGESKVLLTIPPSYNGEGAPSVNDQHKGLKIPPEFGNKSTVKFEVEPGSNTFDIDIPNS